ncbi:MAG: GNAT family N-acetyltransferase [Oscillospiraceae bacterium]|jgi:GNAT superfamily N-acetyltransferase|nr:GNAT family N-acetyltransferase [Oscillospiraceae bacterium]
MRILPYDPSERAHQTALRHLLVQYFAELDYANPKDAVPPSAVPKILSIVADCLAQGEFWTYLARDGGALRGFVIAQVDGEGKDWCKRPGWGFIRELYVAPSHRGKGVAGKLVRRAECSILQSGASRVYLTTDLTGFWEAMGYTNSGEVYEGNGGKIYTKSLRGE